MTSFAVRIGPILPSTAMKRLLILSSALTALFGLTACQTLQDEHQKYLDREENITNVVGNVWRIEATWPHVKESRQLSEPLYDKARAFCERDELGMLPLSGTVEDGSGDATKPAHGWLEFRCQSGLKYRPEYKGMTFHFDPEELTGEEDR